MLEGWHILGCTSCSNDSSVPSWRKQKEQALCSGRHRAASQGPDGQNLGTWAKSMWSHRISSSR